MKQKTLTKKKAYFRNFSWFQVYVFKVSMSMCISCSYRLCVCDFLWQLFSFHTQLISAQFLWESVLLQGCYKNMQKIQILTTLNVPSIRHEGICLKFCIAQNWLTYFTQLYMFSKLLHILLSIFLKGSQLEGNGQNICCLGDSLSQGNKKKTLGLAFFLVCKHVFLFSTTGKPSGTLYFVE